MIETGRVLAVNAYPLGDELTADTAAGATSITVSDAADFSEGGGWLVLAESQTVAYTAADDQTGVLTLAEPTTVTAYEGDTVHVWDDTKGAVSHEVVAMVALEGEDQDADAMEATVPHALIPYLPEDIRSVESEFVSLEWTDGELTVRDVLNRDPKIENAEYLPEVEAGNAVYRGEEPPWPDGDTSHADDDGDLWWHTGTVTNEDGSTSEMMTPYLWDGTASEWVDGSDPTVDLISARMDGSEQDIDALTASVENTSETATDAHNLASTADGRVSFSDYDPAPEDVTYYAKNPDGSLYLDSAGEPVLLTRNPGSVWYTRTRERLNLCTNPSFEIDLTGWTTTAGTGARFDPVEPNDPTDPATPIGGEWVLRITNDATTDGSAEWRDTVDGLAVQPGQTYSASAYALRDDTSGIPADPNGENGEGGAGAYAALRFYDSGGVLLEEVVGDTVLLATEDWRVLTATGTVPDTGAFLVPVFRNPNASDVWTIDGVLVEGAEFAGRYFDGNSYDAEWQGATHASTSHMEGGKIISVYELYDSAWVRLDFTGSTTYDADASDLTQGYLPPERIEDGSVGVEKMKTNEVRASEALLQGDLVNIWSNNGLFYVRKADATVGHEAHGFVLDAASAGDAVRVHTSGYNPFGADLTPGPQFLSTSPGEMTGYPPSQAGHTVQRVGFASDTSTLHFTASQPIRLT